MTQRVALLGGGKMGEALLAGILREQGADSVQVVEQSEPRAAELRASYGVVTPSSVAAAGWADTVIVAVKPAGVAAVLAEIAEALRPDALVISVAAGLTTETLAASLRAGQPLVRVMPNTPAFVGAGMSVLSAGAAAAPAHLDRAEALLATVGAVRRVEESLQDAVTAVSGSGPAYFFYLVEAMAAGGVELGLPAELATELAVQTAYGAGQLLHADPAGPTELRRNVTSPGGSTAAAVSVFDERELPALVAAAMRACRDRSVEMGRGD